MMRTSSFSSVRGRLGGRWVVVGQGGAGRGLPHQGCTWPPDSLHCTTLHCITTPTVKSDMAPKGEAHSLWNAGGKGGGDLLLEITYRPARLGEQMYETLAGGQVLASGRARKGLAGGGWRSWSWSRQ